MRGFARKFAAMIPSRRLQTLKPYHYQLLGDKATALFHANRNINFSLYDEVQDYAIIVLLNKLFTKLSCLHYLKNKLELIPIFEPSNYLKIIWDCIQAFVISIFFFFLPIRIAVEQPITNLMPESAYRAGIILIFLDIIIQMNTSYYDKGVV
jgi:hypothetical protein